MGAAPDARPGLRSDARRNRRRLVDAAKGVMREQGLDAPLGEIARRAGVGNATLYRHFPTREALWEAVFTDFGADLERIRERVLQIPDAWEALVTWLEDMCETCATDQAFADVVAHGKPRSPALDEVGEQGVRLAETLLERAQRQGAVRSDVELADVLLIIYSLHLVVPVAARVAPDGWRRHLAIALDGLRPREGSTLPATGMTFDQLVELGEQVHTGPRRPASRDTETCLSNTGRHQSGVISDELWELIEPELPSSEGRRGRPWRDHRQTFEAILWRYRTGCPWRDLPPEFGPWQTLWKRHRRWSADGVYHRILERIVRS
jgi:AcrR family transcriptional regulator